MMQILDSGVLVYHDCGALFTIDPNECSIMIEMMYDSILQIVAVIDDEIATYTNSNGEDRKVSVLAHKKFKKVITKDFVQNLKKIGFNVIVK